MNIRENYHKNRKKKHTRDQPHHKRDHVAIKKNTQEKHTRDQPHHD